MRRATLGVLLAVACGGGAVMGPGGEGAGAEAAGTEAAGTEAAVRDGSAEVAAEDGDAVASGEGAESPTGPGSASGESSPDGARAGVERGESGGAPTSGGGTGAGPADASNDPEASAMDARRAPAACPAEAPEGMACVGGGWFLRGSERAPNEGPPVEVFVETFFMERHEVTNAAYAECVEAGVCEPPFPYRAFRRPRQPVVAMRWEDADAYCRWRGRRLPTEVEWERGARGPENTTYPWGDDPAGCDRVHVRDRRGHGCGTETTREVGTLPAGHWGLFDMAGNVDEWVADWYAPCFEGCPGACGEACAGEEPRGPCDGAPECRNRLRVVRGGSWWWPLDHATGAFRRGKPPANGVHHRYGFRCARDLAPPRPSE
ncbi:MAG TPA: SUMF1/EgtB/PvdO family nonheme iron enzyme [Polyangiaceae bacterium LLY-WYZ-15_(1-7)]|nr:hypothetical protein [Myxococcales bacterium]MAT29456.1 hypothetical protein [Sandaracinus sp.]HJL01453.1 SUMF1/EgtB/PvdO family nonheme iron enzyme [Polyangiaceae bacterium LLY-WYZ-15_(1-7)]HJL11910.1 SUMF1/EgtB/PvdO family nonheme iron enzyme [Polyangiaceae bacterium LLY-WYZ-15_(1-7)]HJL34915.1 SUMF1/EgtB/PvdO family nonheme iron enzyme [Polyangiaceae bacterium LLY-WYZ-15_(1-7)]